MPLTKRRLVFIALLLLAFLFRLAFGLCSQFVDEDTQQIYLLGLKFYTTGAWPYFGPDVLFGEIQLPGALQGLLVGGPLFILPIPEAPYILLGLLSFAGLCLLAWYSCKRLPELPRWFVWSWLLTAPWVLDLSTTIYNPSYLLFGSILFFVGALEVYPFTSKRIIDARLAHFMIGFGLCWVMQLHMSWPLLIPYALAALYFPMRQGVRAFLRALGWFALGALVTSSVLLPTYFKYGFRQGVGGTNSAITLNTENLTALWGILIRLLSFASFEVPRLLGPHTAQRIALLKANPWLIPFAAFLFVVGTAQVITLIVSWFLRDPSHADWKPIKYLLLFNVLLVYVSFQFSIKPPQSNHLYVTLPIPMIYSMYCWSRLLHYRRWQMFGKILIACGIIFHAGLAASNLRNISIYVERDKIVDAIKAKDYRLLGERRPGSRY